MRSSTRVSSSWRYFLNSSSVFFRSVMSRVTAWNPISFPSFLITHMRVSPHRVFPSLWTHDVSIDLGIFPLIRDASIFMYLGMSFARTEEMFVKRFPTISSLENPVFSTKAVLHEVITPFKSTIPMPSGDSSTMSLYFSSDSLKVSSIFLRSVMLLILRTIP